MVDASSVEGAPTPDLRTTAWQQSEKVGEAPMQEGIRIVQEFVDKLRLQYPSRRYPESIGYPNVCFATYEGSQVVGIVTGMSRDDVLYGQYLIVDPKHEGKSVVKNLANFMKDSYSEVKITASAFGENKDAPGERYRNRQKALVNFYRKIGFKENDTGEINYNVPVHMTWRKQG